MKILVVDADRARLQTIWSILAALGFKGNCVTASLDPSQALLELKKSRIKRDLFNIVFLYGGGENGFQWEKLLQEIRKNSSVDTLPAVIFKPSATKADVMKAIDAGATGLLRYPCSIQDLESVLRLCLSPKSARNRRVA